MDEFIGNSYARQLYLSLPCRIISSVRSACGCALAAWRREINQTKIFRRFFLLSYYYYYFLCFVCVLSLLSPVCHAPELVSWIHSDDVWLCAAFRACRFSLSLLDISLYTTAV